MLLLRESLSQTYMEGSACSKYRGASAMCWSLIGQQCVGHWSVSDVSFRGFVSWQGAHHPGRRLNLTSGYCVSQWVFFGFEIFVIVKTQNVCASCLGNLQVSWPGKLKKLETCDVLCLMYYDVWIFYLKIWPCYLGYELSSMIMLS